jgi:hypothetical protein
MARPDEIQDKLADLDRRIAILRDNIRELIEQASGYSGAADEDRTSGRIADQEAQLAELIRQRDALNDGGASSAP